MEKVSTWSSAGVVLGLAVIYSYLSKATERTLLSVLVLISVTASIMYWQQTNSTNNSNKYKEDTNDNSSGGSSIKSRHLLADIKAVSFPGNFTLPENIPRNGIQYVSENGSFVDILKDLKPVKAFDKNKHMMLTLLFDKLQKTYMYILGGRYNPITHIPIFVDTRKLLLEEMASLALTLPPNFKHIYGISPDELISTNTSKTLAVTRLMLQILQSYSEKTKSNVYVPVDASLPAPTDKARSIFDQF